MTAHLEWGRDQRADVPTLQALEQTLDQLSLQAEQGRPFSVDVLLDSGDALALVVGGSVSMLNFYSRSSRPPVVGCRGPWQGAEGEELFVFDFRGEYSEIERRYTVPSSDAREAARRFYTTGQRPDNITWNT